MSEILDKLFGSSSRVKIIRLFFLNPETVFTSKEISRRAKVASHLARREISLLQKIDFIKESAGHSKKRIRGWTLNPLFPFLLPLKNLVLNAAPISKKELIRKIRGIGHIKLIILSGIFLHEGSDRIDLFVVGDLIQKSALERVLRDIEAEVGKELNYSVMTTKEFSYRLDMYDKFIRDVLDYPHEKIFNKLDI
jgi:hypothetical protein